MQISKTILTNAGEWCDLFELSGFSRDKQLMVHVYISICKIEIHDANSPPLDKGRVAIHQHQFYTSDKGNSGLWIRSEYTANVGVSEFIPKRKAP